MNLWVKLSHSFWAEPRQFKLRSKIGADALWVAPKLLTFAATQDGSGDLSAYPPAALAEALGYQGDGPALIQHLKDAGYLDAKCRIIGWVELFGLAASYGIRAKNRAKGRWAQKPQSRPEEDKKREECHASSETMHDGLTVSPSTAVKRRLIPSRDDWMTKAKSLHPDWPERDAASAFDHYESVGWKKGKTLITKWEACIGTCYRNFAARNPGRAYAPPVVGTSTGLPEPREWKARITKLFPDCIYAPDKDSAGATWNSLSRSSQDSIIDALASK